MERALSLPAGTLADHLRMEIVGNTRVVMEGCRRVLEYEADIIRLDTPDGEVRFTGDRLCLNCLTPLGTVITGTILSIEYRGG